jgi:long-subunit fatty acid transport protein
MTCPTTAGSHAPAPDTASIADLSQFDERWTIEYETERSVWSAEQRSADGHSFRYIVERSPASLAAKLLTAETAAP